MVKRYEWIQMNRIKLFIHKFTSYKHIVFFTFTANETLLRTLLSYCSLHGASGGGLASVRMELVLLLQELQQEKTQQQLLSPLPFPTTLPLLSACVAGNRTVIADPIRYLEVSKIYSSSSIVFLLQSFNGIGFFIGSNS